MTIYYSAHKKPAGLA